MMENLDVVNSYDANEIVKKIIDIANDYQEISERCIVYMK